MSDKANEKKESETEQEQEAKVEKQIEKIEKEDEKLADKIVQLQQKLQENENKIAEYEERIKSINSDYAKKITEKAEQANEIVKNKIKELEEKHNSTISEVKKYGAEKAIIEFIDIIQQLKSAINFKSDDPKINNFLMGFKMFAQMFDNALSNVNVSEIIVKVGDDFDPATMDAFDTTNNPELDNDKVSEVISNAYKLHDRIVKHAVVKVNKK